MSCKYLTICILQQLKSFPTFQQNNNFYNLRAEGYMVKAEDFSKLHILNNYAVFQSDDNFPGSTGIAIDCDEVGEDLLISRNKFYAENEMATCFNIEDAFFTTEMPGEISNNFISGFQKMSDFDGVANMNYYNNSFW